MDWLKAAYEWIKESITERDSERIQEKLRTDKNRSTSNLGCIIAGIIALLLLILICQAYLPMFKFQ